MPRAASWASTPTGAMDAVRRTTAKLPPEDFHLAGMLPTPVSATRRTRGSLIALGFLVVLLGLATWFAYDTVSSLTAKRQGALTPSVAKP
jgi:hypothetical protein